MYITFEFFKDLRNENIFSIYDTLDPSCIGLRSLYPDDSWEVTHTVNLVYSHTVLTCRDSNKIVDSLRTIDRFRVTIPWPNEDALK